MAEKAKAAVVYERGLFRYGIISDLISRPPKEGELAERLREIAQRSFLQPWDKKEINVSVRTLERWYSIAKKDGRPSDALQQKLRSDRGESRVLTQWHKSSLDNFRLTYPCWSIQLMYDNLEVMPSKDKMPSYSTVLRYFHRLGFFTKKYSGKNKKTKEIRSFEVEYVGQMWHMDFHKSGRHVVTEKGEYKEAICMAIIDDNSRLACHVQWFINETTEVLVHGLIQAILKRGMPRTFYTDNGSAMKAEELKIGLEYLSIKAEKTLPYSPYMNGKQESFWQPLEGRLMKMIPKNKKINLEILNNLTQAWVEQDYQVRFHSEIKGKPLDRFLNSTNVLRPSPRHEELKRSFRMIIDRNVRKTDGTVTIDGVRFQIPQQYIHFDKILLRYARWDLSEAEIICPDTRKGLCTISPLDKRLNSNGFRKQVDNKLEFQSEEIACDENNNFDLLNIKTDHLPPLMAHCLKKHNEQYPFPSYVSLPNQNK